MPRMRPTTGDTAMERKSRGGLTVPCAFGPCAWPRMDGISAIGKFINLDSGPGRDRVAVRGNHMAASAAQGRTTIWKNRWISICHLTGTGARSYPAVAAENREQGISGKALPVFSGCAARGLRELSLR